MKPKLTFCMHIRKQSVNVDCTPVATCTSMSLQDRDAAVTEEGQTAGGPPASTDSAAGDQGFLGELLSTSYVVQPPGTGDMRHGTEGWRSLETSFKVILHPL